MWRGVLLVGWHLRGLLRGVHSLPAMLHQLVHAHALLVQHVRTREVRLGEGQGSDISRRHLHGPRAAAE